MSVPVLLTMLDANAATAAAASPNAAIAAAMTATTLLLDEHIKSCASYVESASVLTSNFAADAISEIAVIETTKTSCTPVQRRFTVQFDVELEQNERVGLTGDSKALGEWQLERCVTLEPLAERSWSAEVMLQACRNINYRYFTYVVDKQGRKQIRRWETQLQPRLLTDVSTAEAANAVERFGIVSNNSTAPQVNRGWLTNEAIVQLKFEREQMFQVHDIDKFDPENVLIKIVPLDDVDLETVLDAHAGINVEVAKLKYGESRLQPQQSFGIEYTRGDVVIFHVTVPYPLDTAFAVVFHTSDNEPIGKCIITASQLINSEGVLKLAVTDSQKNSDIIVARLALPYLIVKPFSDATLDFRTTYAHYWPKSWPKLDVGHRGNGKSYLANPPPERENTLASFLRAHEKYADMVELDVHLTADGIPIIYHDFGVRTAPQGKQITDAKQLEYVLLKDLSYEAVKKMRIFAVIDDKPVEFPSHNAEPRVEHRIFPTLVDVLDGLPKSLGIDVEIKWPQRRASGGVEAHQTIDKNFFIDRVLSIVIKHGCGRPLLFSSFDADMCTMLRFKQNLFPVMFLTMGETKKWAPFMDLRTRNFEQALNNAQAFELAGTAPHAEDFLGSQGADLIKKAQDLGQLTLVWGDDVNSSERVKYFIEIGANAICYDRSDLYMPEQKERAFFNSTMLLAEFQAHCRR